MATRLLCIQKTATRLGVHEDTACNWESKGLLHPIRLPARCDVNDVNRMTREMRSHLAPADEGYVIEPSKPITGTHIAYDDIGTEKTEDSTHS
jgi:hypothetical protein